MTTAQIMIGTVDELVAHALKLSESYRSYLESNPEAEVCADDCHSESGFLRQICGGYGYCFYRVAVLDAEHEGSWHFSLRAFHFFVRTAESVAERRVAAARLSEAGSVAWVAACCPTVVTIHTPGGPVQAYAGIAASDIESTNRFIGVVPALPENSDEGGTPLETA